MYQEDSQNLAYLLALISCSVDMETGIAGDIWCTGAHPIETLAGILARIVTNDPAPVAKTREFVKEMQQPNSKDEWDALRRIAQILRSARFPCTSEDGSARKPCTPLVLLIDQFEEIYTLGDDAAERQQFTENLLFAAADKSCALSVIITLRSDFLKQTQSHSVLNHAIAEQSVIVPAMTKEERWLAIAEPARLAGRPLDMATVSLLIAETEEHEGALPLLEFALTRIWEGMAEGVEPVDTLKNIGGVGGALAGEAQRLFDSLKPEHRQIARRAFLAIAALLRYMPINSVEKRPS